MIIAQIHLLLSLEHQAANSSGLHLGQGNSADDVGLIGEL